MPDSTVAGRPADPSPARASLERLYDAVTGDEDARVCRDIPESACREQPRNFFAYLCANLLNKVADEIASARLVLPWLFGALGVPAAFTAFLVPIREAGVLLPQLVVAALIRRLPRRKGVWLLGGALSALALLGMAVAALRLDGVAAGAVLLALLVLFSLARGLCSVSAKDVLGKTVSKSRRGVLMGWSAGLSGLAVLAVGIGLGLLGGERLAAVVFAALFGVAALLWLGALAAFAAIREAPGATEGGGNALAVALGQLGLLVRDRAFRAFVITRSLLLGVALAPPFYVLLAQGHTGGGVTGLGWLIVATGVGGSLSSPVWGRMADRSSRRVMALAAAGHGVLALGVVLAADLQLGVTARPGFWAGVMVALTVLHSGVRLGRKVYLVDMADEQTRAAYVALSNTVIGIAMLLAGALGLLADRLGTEAALAALGVVSLVAALRARALPEVSG